MSICSVCVVAEFNERMAAARYNAGLSLMDVAFELRRLLPKSMWVSPPTLNRLEHNTPEDRADPFLVIVLADVYGVPVADLSPLVARDSKRLMGLLRSNRKPFPDAATARYTQQVAA